MGTWFSVVLGDALIAWEPLGRIETLFESGRSSADDSGSRAVFIRYESEGRLHCEVTAYFSPAAAEVAREVDAKPCERPSRDGLSLLAGVEDSWSKLFP
jgi:hypothetical protein